MPEEKASHYRFTWLSFWQFNPIKKQFCISTCLKKKPLIIELHDFLSGNLLLLTNNAF